MTKPNPVRESFEKEWPAISDPSRTYIPLDLKELRDWLATFDGCEIVRPEAEEKPRADERLDRLQERVSKLEVAVWPPFGMRR